ncbi:MAG TPA: hypothetical protein PKV98_16030, partial [Burkholderiaceae bacterium]|nr:hypothetical protein [Burkholderiaceae bacterium]
MPADRPKPFLPPFLSLCGFPPRDFDPRRLPTGGLLPCGLLTRCFLPCRLLTRRLLSRGFLLRGFLA